MSEGINIADLLVMLGLIGFFVAAASYSYIVFTEATMQIPKGTWECMEWQTNNQTYVKDYVTFSGFFQNGSVIIRGRTDGKIDVTLFNKVCLKEQFVRYP